MDCALCGGISDVRTAHRNVRWKRRANDMTDLRQQMEFLLEMDRAKQIGRQTYLSDGSRKENDAEHSWHMALMDRCVKDDENDPAARCDRDRCRGYVCL